MPTTISRTRALGLATAVAFATLVPAASAQASSPVPAVAAAVSSSQRPAVKVTSAAKKVKLSKAVEKKIRAELKAAGVSAAKRDSLVAKLKAHKKWDAITSGKKPKTVKKYSSGGYRYVKGTFADGSIWLWRTTIHKKISTSAVTGSYSDCTTYVADHYHISGTGCDVRASTIGLFSMSYTFDYTAAPTYRKITRTYNLRGSGIQEGVKNTRFEMQSDWDVRAYGDVKLGVKDYSITFTVYMGTRVNETGSFSGYTSGGW
jgi:hypothetical protein